MQSVLRSKGTGVGCPFFLSLFLEFVNFSRKCLYGVNIVSTPEDGERLMQVADFVSTLKLLDFKIEMQGVSRIEKDIFETDRNVRWQFLKHLDDKELK